MHRIPLSVISIIALAGCANLSTQPPATPAAAENHTTPYRTEPDQA